MGKSTVRIAILTTVAAVATSTVVLVSAPPGQAAPRPSTPPAFLAAEELPPHPASPWYAGPVTAGPPEHPVFCLGTLTRAKGVFHREFWTEYDTGAIQLVIEARSVPSAREVAARAEQAIRTCAADYARAYPGGTAAWRDYGALDVEDGAHVYGVATRTDYGANDINLFGVGRDGRTVTLVRWGQMGTFEHAEVEPFTDTSRTAVAKLYP